MLSGVLLTAEGLVRGRKEIAPTRVRSVLFLEYMLPLGCVVHMTPTFEAIKRSRPEIEEVLSQPAA